MPLTQMQLFELKGILEIFGLSRGEQDVYLCLLREGVATATPVANFLDIPLTTAQFNLRRLAEKGLINLTKRKSRSVYEARDPSVLKTLFEYKLQDIAKAIPLLQGIRSESVIPSKITVYSRERFTEIFRLALQSKEKLIHEVVSAREFQDILGERFHFTRRRIEASVQLKSLRIEANEIKKYNKATHDRELREAKFLPADLTFTSSFLFWDDTAAFFTPANEGLAFVVKSQSIRFMLQQIFDLLWSISRRMETLPEIKNTR